MAKFRKQTSSPLPGHEPCPEQKGGDFVRPVMPQGSLPLDVIVVGQVVYGAFTHWIDNKPHRHQGSEHTCMGCRVAGKPRWNGYVNCVLYPSLRRRIAVITKGAYQNSESLQAYDGKLRGMALRLVRLGTSKNAPVKAIVMHPTVSVELPKDWNVVAALERLFKNQALPTEGADDVDGNTAAAGGVADFDQGDGEAEHGG
jgi:hypothetical protein